MLIFRRLYCTAIETGIPGTDQYTAIETVIPETVHCISDGMRHWKLPTVIRLKPRQWRMLTRY